jgi:transcriptional regulator with XRE-family HTH domain
MITFGKKIAILRKDLGLSQTELAKKLNTSVSVISRYERDEMVPSIDTAKKLADFLESTVAYLLGENEEANLFREPEILARFKEIGEFSSEEKEKVFFTLDAMIHEVKNRKQYTKI